MVFRSPDGADRQWPKSTEGDIGAFVWDTTNVNTLQTSEGVQVPDMESGFEMVTTDPRKYAGYARISDELLTDAAPNVEMQVGTMLARDLSRKIETAYAQGRGTNNEPDGVFKITVVDNTDYTGTGNTRRIVTATRGAVTYQELAQVAYAVEDYSGVSTPAWVMSRPTVGSIIRVMGGDGHPIFKYAPYFAGGMTPGAGQREFGDLLGFPVRLAYRTGTLTNNAAGANAIVACFGSWDQYLIHDVETIQLRRSDAARFLYGQTDFKVETRTDGKFLNPQVFAWLKNKAS